MKSFTFQGPANILFEAGAERKMADLGGRDCRHLPKSKPGV